MDADVSEIYDAVKNAECRLKKEVRESKKKKINTLLVSTNSSESTGTSCFGSNTLSSIGSISTTAESPSNASSLTLIEDIEMPSLNESAILIEKITSLSESSQNVTFQSFNESNYSKQKSPCDRPAADQKYLPDLKISRLIDNNNGEELSEPKSSSPSELQSSLLFLEAECVLKELENEKKEWNEISPPSTRLTILDLSNLNDSLLVTPKLKTHHKNSTWVGTDPPKMSTPKSTENNMKEMKHLVNLNGTYDIETPLKKEGTFTLEEGEARNLTMDLKGTKKCIVNTTWEKGSEDDRKTDEVVVTGKPKGLTESPCPAVSETRILKMNTTFDKDSECADKVSRRVNTTFEKKTIETKPMCVNTTFDTVATDHCKDNLNTTYNLNSKQNSPEGTLNETLEVIGNGVFRVDGKCTSLIDMEAKELSVVLNSGKNTPNKRRSFCEDDSKKICVSTLFERLTKLGTESKETVEEKEAKVDRVVEGGSSKPEEIKNTKNPLSKVDSYQTMGPLTAQEALLRLRKKPKSHALGSTGPMKAVPIPSAIADLGANADKKEEQPKGQCSTPLNALYRSQHLKKGKYNNEEKSSTSSLPASGTFNTDDSEGCTSVEQRKNGISTPDMTRRNDLKGPQMASTPAMENNNFACNFGMNCAPTPIICPLPKASRLFREVINSSCSDLSEGKNHGSSVKMDDLNNINVEDITRQDKGELAEYMQGSVVECLDTSKEVKEIKHEDILASTHKESIAAVLGENIINNTEPANVGNLKNDSTFERLQIGVSPQDSVIKEYEMSLFESENKHSNEVESFNLSKERCHPSTACKEIAVEEIVDGCPQFEGNTVKRNQTVNQEILQSENNELVINLSSNNNSSAKKDGTMQEFPNSLNKDVTQFHTSSQNITKLKPGTDKIQIVDSSRSLSDMREVGTLKKSKTAYKGSNPGTLSKIKAPVLKVNPTISKQRAISASSISTTRTDSKLSKATSQPISKSTQEIDSQGRRQSGSKIQHTIQQNTTIRRLSGNRITPKIGDRRSVSKVLNSTTTNKENTPVGKSLGTGQTLSNSSVKKNEKFSQSKEPRTKDISTREKITPKIGDRSSMSKVLNRTTTNKENTPVGKCLGTGQTLSNSSVKKNEKFSQSKEPRTKDISTREKTSSKVGALPKISSQVPRSGVLKPTSKANNPTLFVKPPSKPIPNSSLQTKQQQIRSQPQGRTQGPKLQSTQRKYAQKENKVPNTEKSTVTKIKTTNDSKKENTTHESRPNKFGFNAKGVTNVTRNTESKVRAPARTTIPAPRYSRK